MTSSIAVLGLLLFQGASPADSYAIVGVDVVPMDREIVLRDQTVLVTAGRIQRIGPATEVDVPPDATVIDGGDRYLMPGLVDMHVHTWFDTDHPLFLANGVTMVRNMFGGPIHLEWRAEIESGERLGPTMYTAGPIVDGNPPIWPGSRVVETPEDGRAAVLEHVEAGYDFVKVYNGVPLEAYEAIVEAAEEAGLPVMGHVPDGVGLEEVLLARQRTIEHLTGYVQVVRSMDSAYARKSDWISRFRSWEFLDPRRVEVFAARTEESEVWNCVTLVVLQKRVPAEKFGEMMKHPTVRYVSPATRAFWMTRSGSSELNRAMQKGHAGRLELTRALHAAGAGLVLGTDCGNPFVIPGFSVHEELANFIDAGLSPYEALRAGTANPARCLEAEDEFGTVAEGLRADLILLAENPLEDVAHASVPLGVMVRGRWLPREDLESRLRALEASFAPAGGEGEEGD